MRDPPIFLELPLLIIRPSIDDVLHGISSWDWIDFSGLRPVVVSCFGDVFFESATEVLMLDTVAGELRPICSNPAELQDILNTKDGRDDLLMACLVEYLVPEGLELGVGECYDFIIPPALNGEMLPANVQIMAFRDCLNALGQVHKQIKNDPVGTVYDVDLPRT